MSQTIYKYYKKKPVLLNDDDGDLIRNFLSFSLIFVISFYFSDLLVAKGKHVITNVVTSLSTSSLIHYGNLEDYVEFDTR